MRGEFHIAQQIGAVMEPSHRTPPPPIPPLNGRPDGAHVDRTPAAGAHRRREERATVRVENVSVGAIHPAIAQPPPCAADAHWAVDRVLYTIAAAMALGFVAWGLVSPTGLGTVSGTM